MANLREVRLVVVLRGHQVRFEAFGLRGGAIAFLVIVIIVAAIEI
jgi:hypothetical protein